MPKQPYGALLFDLDGTLIDSEVCISNCIKHALSKVSDKDYSNFDFTDRIGPPLTETFEILLGREKVEQAIRHYQERFRHEGLSENSLYDGIADLLDATKAAGYKQYVATAKISEFASLILRYLKVADYFDGIFGVDYDTGVLTKVDVIKRALGQAEIDGVAKERVLMIGDTVYDIVGANECGIPCAAVTYGFGSLKAMSEEQPLAILSSVAELKDFLLNR